MALAEVSLMAEAVVAHHPQWDLGVVVCRLVEHHVEEHQEEVQGVELQRGGPPPEEVVLHPKHQPEEAQPLAQDRQPRLRG